MTIAMRDVEIDIWLASRDYTNVSRFGALNYSASFRKRRFMVCILLKPSSPTLPTNNLIP